MQRKKEVAKKKRMEKKLRNRKKREKRMNNNGNMELKEDLKRNNVNIYKRKANTNKKIIK